MIWNLSASTGVKTIFLFVFSSEWKLYVRTLSIDILCSLDNWQFFKLQLLSFAEEYDILVVKMMIRD